MSLEEFHKGRDQKPLRRVKFLGQISLFQMGNEMITAPIKVT